MRLKGEIQVTFDEGNKLNGCIFMNTQQRYNNPTQRVLKPLERFVDARDYHVKKAKGVILTEGLICEEMPVQ
jgi:hypothetical protein